MALENGMRRNTLSRALISILPVAATSVLGQMATSPNLVPWYAGLAKPAFNPPGWVFAPVWTSLYVLMACAVWRILDLPGSTPQRRLALILFFSQLVLNAIWPWLFFGRQSPLAGMCNIVPQLLVIAGTIVVVRKLDRIAAWCLVPLAAWVAFAAVLNFEIWRLNSGAAWP